MLGIIEWLKSKNLIIINPRRVGKLIYADEIITDAKYMKEYQIFRKDFNTFVASAAGETPSSAKFMENVRLIGLWLNCKQLESTHLWTVILGVLTFVLAFLTSVLIIVSITLS